MSTATKTTTVGVLSLGCQKNTVDTERMLGLLDQAGYAVVNEPQDAEVVIVNTCSFLAASQRESIRAILDVSQLERKLIVTGCLPQRHKEELLDAMPEVHAIIGTAEFPQIVPVVARVLSGERFAMVGEKAEVPDYDPETPRMLTTIGPSAYLKIAEGCDHTCTFCIIPQLRGGYASRPQDMVVAEAKRLADAGIKELVLIAQDTTRYGQKETGKLLLPELLEALNDVDGVEWIRILYAYPNYLPDRALKAINDLPKVIPYLDVPLQHTHPEMLKAMKRPHREDPRGFIRRMREQVPGIVLRTTFITGFPGETEAHHADMLDFVRTMELDHVGVFAYSTEEGTEAGAMPDQLPVKLRNARRKAVLAAQQEVSARIQARLVGQVLPFLVEGTTPDGRLVGRTHRDAPEIDGVTVVSAPTAIDPGRIVPVRITGADAYDLVGELVV